MVGKIETFCPELQGVPFPNRKGLHQRQIQPAEAWRPHNVPSSIAEFPAAGQRIEPLESGDVKPTLDGFGSVVRIGYHVRTICRKSLDFRRASRLRVIHTVINRERRATTEIGDAIQLPAGKDRLGNTGAFLKIGSSQEALITQRWRASKMDGPCSALRLNGF